MTWPDGVSGDPSAVLVLDAAARDVVTAADGTGRVSGEVRLRTTVVPGRRVTAIEAEPADVDLAPLVGLTAASGWRAATRQLVPDGLASPLGLLLDEVPIAVLLSFYAALRAGNLGGTLSLRSSEHMRDLCAGWADGATPMRSLDAGGPVPLPALVAVPPPTEADPLATEARPALAPGMLRRSRRVDVVPGPVLQVEATFRDSWADPAGGEGILHEYVVTARVAPDGTLLEVAAEPRVLPYTECPAAASSPARLVGQHVANTAAAGLTGPSTCTHLSDLLRSLACVPGLAAQGGDEAIR
jgi:hypothetical protein